MDADRYSSSRMFMQYFGWDSVCVRRAPHPSRRGCRDAFPSRGRHRQRAMHDFIRGGPCPLGLPRGSNISKPSIIRAARGKAKGAQRHESPPKSGGLCDTYILLYSGVRRAQVLCTRAHKPAPARGTARSVSPMGRTAQRPAVRSRTCAAKASPASSGSRAQTVTAAAYCVSCTTPPSAATAARTGS